MIFKGVHHVELSALEYEGSIKFFDRMFGCFGYKSLWLLDIGYHPQIEGRQVEVIYCELSRRLARSIPELIIADNHYKIR